MVKEECVLPVQCSKCGGMFDLWYDVVAGEGDGFEEHRIEENSLCWACRKVGSREMWVSKEVSV